MRIERLALSRFGRFDSCELELGGGLAVVHGANEAGKTTLLHALRYFLFRIPTQNSFGYRFQEMGYSGMEIRAALVEASGARLELARTKSRSDSLKGERVERGATTRATEVTLQRLLGGVNQEIYELVFGFTLADLEAGAKLLQNARIEELIAGASLGGGGGRITSTIKSLAERTEALFKPTGSRPLINSLVARAAGVAREQKGATLLQSSLLDLRRTLEQVKAEARELSASLDTLRARESRARRRHDALPDLRELERLQARLRELGQPLTSLAAAGEIETAVDARRRASDHLETLEQERAQLMARAAALQVDLPLLAVESNVLDLWKRGTLVRDYQLRHDRTLVEIRGEEQELQVELEALTTGKDLGWLTRFAVPAKLRRTLESLSRSDREDRAELDAVTRDLQQYRQQRDAIVRELEEPSPQEATAGLEELAASRPGVVAMKQRAEHLQVEIATETRRIETRAARMAPSAPAVVLRLDAPLPATEQVEAARQELSQIEQRIKDDEHKIVERRTRQTTLETELHRLAAGGEAPSHEQLQELRSRRDELWQLAVRSWRDGEDVSRLLAQLEVAGELSDAVRQAIAAADAASDRMLLASEQLRIRVDIDLAVAARQRAEGRLEETRAALGRWESWWERLWADAGVASPLRPESMQRWLEDARSIREQAETLQDRRVELEGLEVQLEAWRARASTVLAQQPRSVGEALDLLEKRQQRMVAESGARESARTRLRQLNESIATLESREQALAAARADHAGAFAGAMSGLDLETDDVEGGASRVAEIEKLATRARKLIGARETLESEQAALEEFERDVEGLATSLGRRTPGASSGQLIESMHSELLLAQQNRSARAVVDDSLLENQSAIDTQRDALARADRQLGELRAQQSAEDDEELVTRAARMRERDRLQVSADAVDSRLARILGSGEQRRSEEESLAGVDQDALVAELARLRDEIAAATELATAASEKVGAAQQALDSLGGDLAAQKQAQLQEVVADLETATDEYLILALARQTLEQVVESYARDHQPALLASTAELFDEITGGRYVNVEMPPGEKRLFCLTPDGDRRSVDDLSTGTREQLFLALRLAYVLEHCREGEPLPIVMDDVLVNFDPVRTQATLAALGRIARQTQVIYLTCHSHVVEVARSTVPDVTILEL